MPNDPIRLATTVDVPLIAQRAREAYAMYVDRMGREPAATIADFATAVRNGTVCVAEEGSQLAGYVVFYAKYDHLHLENIAVRSQFQGQGVGRQLLRHVEDAARQRGRVAVELYTNAKMFENLAMYPKLGKVQIDRRLEDGFDRVFFRKVLSMAAGWSGF